MDARSDWVLDPSDEYQREHPNWNKPAEPDWRELSGDALLEKLGIRNAGKIAYEAIPPREWLLGTTFCRRFLSSLLGDGGVGKTALRIAQYASVASGRKLTGEYVFQRCPVLVASFEDDQTELERRVYAMLLHYGIERGDLDEWLYLWAPKKLKLMAMKQGSPQLGELEGMLRHIIKDRGIGLWGLDPFVKTHAVPENDNGAMDIVCETLASIAIDLNCAGDIPHHTSKGIKTPGDAQSGRGASSTVNAGRLVYTLNQMSPDEAKLLGTPEGERRSFIRVDSGKVNIAPHSREAKWFRLVGVPLGNGNATYPNGDNVQTVVPWLPPKMWEGTDDAVLNRILDAIDAGLENGQRYSDAPKTGADRAAWRVVQRHLADKAEPLCREIIKAWVRAGVLVSDSYHDPVERKDRKGLSVDPSKRPGAPCVGERDYEVTPIEEHG